MAKRKTGFQFDAQKALTTKSIEVYRELPFLSPYIALVQSSGTGKTRALRKLSQFVPTVYLCSRKDGESGYPRGTPGIEVFLGTMTDERSAMHGWAAVFMAIFKDISEVNEFGLDFFQDQINLNVDVAPSIESIVQTALGILNKRKPEALFSIQYYEEEKFLGLVAEVIRPQFLKFQKSLESYMDRNNLIPNEIFDVAGHPLYLLVVFDEARSLLKTPQNLFWPFVAL